MTTLTADDIRDFNGYLAACTDSQVIGVYEKERDAGREAYAALARAEATKRGIADQCMPSRLTETTTIPPCPSDTRHHLKSPREVFGGPALDKHGGALVRECCVLCGLYVFTDSKGAVTTYPPDTASLAQTVPLSHRRRDHVGERPERQGKRTGRGKRTVPVPKG